MTQLTETESRELKDLLTGMREEIRVGFANVDTKFAEVKGDIKELRAELKGLDIKITGDIKELRAELKGLDTKFDERTKLGFWGFILRGSVLTAIVGIGGFILSIVAEYVHKMPSL